MEAKSRKTSLALLLAAALAAVGITAAPRLAEECTCAVTRERAEPDGKPTDRDGTGVRLSALFARASKAVKPSVVVVRVKQKVRMRSPGIFSDPFFKRFFGDRFKSPEKEEQNGFRMIRGQGSGVIVDAKNGYVLTNYHVVGTADEVDIITADDRTFEAEWVRGDAKTDLAVVKIEGENLAATTLGDSDAVETGQWVIAVGAPLGLPQTVTAGIISAKGRMTDPRMYQNFLQTDAAINRGNSGGPLTNLDGEIVGINTAILSNTGMNAGVGLAIPSNMAKHIMHQLIEKGTVQRGYLGVYLQPVTDDLAKAMKLPHANGALVTKVQDETPAAKAGLREKDFITTLNGEDVESVAQLRRKVASLSPNETVALEIYREGDTKTIEVTLGTLPAETAEGPTRRRQPKQTLEKLGLAVTALTDRLARRAGYPADTEGVIITKIAAGNPAAKAGLKAGDVITSANDRPVNTAEEFAAIADRAAATGITLRVVDSRGGTRYVLLKSADG